MKIVQGLRPCGAFIFHILSKSPSEWGEIWHGGGCPHLHAKFHPNWCNVSPMRGEKPQNRPLSKLNTVRLRFTQRQVALRAMLPVTIAKGVESEGGNRGECSEGG